MSGNKGYFYLIFGLFLVVSNVTLLLHFEPKQLYWKVLLVALGEAGFALIIAFVFSRTLEKEAKREYNKFVQEKQKVLSKNIFDYIYSVKVDKSVFEFLEKYIYQEPFFRINMKIEYEFCEIKNGWVLLRSEYSYIVKNISSEAKKYDIDFDIEKPLGEVPDFEKLGVYRFEFGDDSLTDAAIEKSDEAADDGENFRKYKKECTINSGEEIAVRIGAYSAKRLNDAELWRSGLISDSLDIRIRFDTDAFDVRLIPVHPAIESFQIRTDDHQITAEIKEPLMPKNGVYFWWAKKGDEN